VVFGWFCFCSCCNCWKMDSGVAAPVELAPVVLSGGGGLGASTMPVLEAVVDGVGTESMGTELVVG
jgi:hypothetical protein